jgi:hypothetical protein
VVTLPFGSRCWVTSPNALRPSVITGEVELELPLTQVVRTAAVAVSNFPVRS